MRIFRIGCRWATGSEATADREILDVFIRLGIVFLGDERCRDGFEANIKPGDILLINSGTCVKAIAIAQSSVYPLEDFDIDEESVQSDTYPDFDFSVAKGHSLCCDATIYELDKADYLEVTRGYPFSGCYEIEEKKNK